MASAENQKELDRISLELDTLTAHRHTLSNRLHLLSVLKEFRQTANYQQEAEADGKDESGKIEEELEELSEREVELQALVEKLKRAVSGETFSVTQKHHPCNDEIFIVERPPGYQAPQVITDMMKLPRHSAQIQCPYCEQYVTTEASSVIGNTACLACLVCGFMGCIAGCCLLPFCVSSFKDVLHKCPNCRSHLHTHTKM